MCFCCTACPACVSHWSRLRNRLSYIAVDYYQLHYLFFSLCSFVLLLCLLRLVSSLAGVDGGTKKNKKKPNKISLRWLRFGVTESKTKLGLDLKGFCVLMIARSLSLPPSLSFLLSTSLSVYLFPFWDLRLFGWHNSITEHASHQLGLSNYELSWVGHIYQLASLQKCISKVPSSSMFVFVHEAIKQKWSRCRR